MITIVGSMKKEYLVVHEILFQTTIFTVGVDGNLYIWQRS